MIDRFGFEGDGVFVSGVLDEGIGFFVFVKVLSRKEFYVFRDLGEDLYSLNVFGSRRRFYMRLLGNVRLYVWILFLEL